MQRIKCKVCQQKFKVETQDEVKCTRTDCPHVEFGPREYDIVTFKNYPTHKVEYIEDFQTPPPPEVIVNFADFC